MYYEVYRICFNIQRKLASQLSIINTNAICMGRSPYIVTTLLYIIIQSLLTLMCGVTLHAITIQRANELVGVISLYKQQQKQEIIIYLIM